MNEATARLVLTALRENFFAAWSRGQWQALSPSLASNAMLTSSQHGEGNGEAAWREALADDAAALSWMRSSNHAVLVGDNGQAATSAYVFGLFSRGQRQFLFGASVVLRFNLTRSQWLLVGARINVNWCKGDITLASHWRARPKDVGWQLGDPVPAIVSEIDSPWALIGEPLHAASEENAMRELYSK
jgi:hypothetical protein